MIALSTGSVRSVAVVSGAGGGGIGSSILTRLLRDGYFVVTIERTEEGCKSVRSRLIADDGFVLLGDIGKEQTSREAAEYLRAEGRGCDLIVHNAARGAPFRTLDSIEEAEFRQDIDDILMGGFFMTKHLHQVMPSHTASRIIFISSAAAIRGSLGRGPSYAAAKAGLHGLVKQLALQLGASGTTVNAVVPYQTMTPRVLRGNRRSAATIEETARKMIPIGRSAYPEDISSVVSFLASPGAGYMTGQIVELDGGRSLAPMWTRPENTQQKK